MKVELKKWALDDKKQLMDICNSVERDYLSDRLPYPYTEECADWWLNMVLEHDGKDGVFRAIVADGKIVGNISVEQKSDVYKKDAEIGYMLATEEWSRGIMTKRPLRSFLFFGSPEWFTHRTRHPDGCWRKMDLNWKGS